MTSTSPTPPARERLPSDTVQHIQFEGCDVCVIAPEDYDALVVERDELSTIRWRLIDEANALQDQRDALVSILDEALEYFEDREDVIDGSYGEPGPNKEMALAQLIRFALKFPAVKPASAPQNRGSNLNKACDCKGSSDLAEHQPWCAALRAARGDGK